jgi:23S rRNA (guanine1835-N2)-methyltransferase
MIKFSDEIKNKILSKYPKDKRASQPYSATDSYLFDSFLEKDISQEKSLLILNDETGVLSFLLKDFSPISCSDSLYSKLSIEENYKNNSETFNSKLFVNSIEFEELVGKQEFDTVLIKLPKSQKLFEEQLVLLTQMVNPETTLLISGMVKHISKKCSESIKNFFGEVQIGRVKKKAIQFSATWDEKVREKKELKQFYIENYGQFKSYVNSFSNGKLDKGTALLLKSLPEDISGDVVDLGCGYGVISRVLDQNYSDISTLTAIDISAMAVASTKLNVPKAKVIWEDGVTQLERESVDFIISNPPFHAGTSFSINEGLRLFKQAIKVLKFGGKFILVANKGLNYGNILDKLFSQVRVLDENRNYTVFEVVK